MMVLLNSGYLTTRNILYHDIMGSDNMENNDNKAECPLCRRYGIEKGDTLYQVAYPDTGIDFYAICDIKYCPLCGKELKEDNT